MVQEQAVAAPATEAVPAAKQDEQPKPFSVKDGMQGIFSLLEKSVKTKETRLLMGRLMRQTAMVRKHMTATDLSGFIKAYLPETSTSAEFLATYLKQVGGFVEAVSMAGCSCHLAQVTERLSSRMLRVATKSRTDNYCRMHRTPRFSDDSTCLSG